MTWAYAAVMVEAEITDHNEVYQRIEELIAPYDESMDVPEYLIDCYCLRQDSNPTPGIAVSDCGWCNGTGKESTQYNPNSKWDWWHMMDECPSDDPDWVPYTFIAPEAGWQSRGDIGWFGISDNERDDWDDTYRNAVTYAQARGMRIHYIKYHI